MVSSPLSGPQFPQLSKGGATTLISEAAEKIKRDGGSRLERSVAVADALQRLEKYMFPPKVLVRSQRQGAGGQGKQVSRGQAVPGRGHYAGSLGLSWGSCAARAGVWEGDTGSLWCRAA